MRTHIAGVKRFRKLAGLTEDLDLSDTPKFRDDFRSLFYPYLKLYGVEDEGFYSVVKVGYYGEIVLAEKVKGKDICRVYEEALDDQFGLEYLRDMVEGMFTDEEFPESCVRDGIEGIVSLVLDQDDVLDIRPVSLKEDDLDLSDTPEFDSMPTPEEVMEYPSYISFMDDSDYNYDRFGFAEIGGQVYYIPDLELDTEDMQVVKLIKGLSLDKLIDTGVEKGFFEIDDDDYFYNMDLEIEINDWLDSLTA